MKLRGNYQTSNIVFASGQPASFTMKMAASDIETYAKKHGGIDKKDMMKVASMLQGDWVWLTHVYIYGMLQGDWVWLTHVYMYGMLHLIREIP